MARNDRKSETSKENIELTDESLIQTQQNSGQITVAKSKAAAKGNMPPHQKVSASVGCICFYSVGLPETKSSWSIEHVEPMDHGLHSQEYLGSNKSRSPDQQLRRKEAHLLINAYSAETARISSTSVSRCRLHKVWYPSTSNKCGIG